ncbi:hypothetical protein SAMN05216341_1199 [Leuconostocaceae bacterium R-53105]|uniref:Uncharacterized protein n=1 Tax=Convivina intestini TaxID=1505726 RepID=A0A2U1D569_9LACO|nr:hypothetical protein C7384_11027 [Convivina intestini]CAH1856834.1 hypothetical protein R077811_01349 [Convivina intestini]SDC19581.1 hypothetical protein SAMN05216341_1199 [Leuconostocaceae bacterium R-53105]
MSLVKVQFSTDMKGKKTFYVSTPNRRLLNAIKSKNYIALNSAEAGLAYLEE